MMFTVALIGPDGSGKSTLCQRLVDESTLPTKRIYMGPNPEAYTHRLPTTRLLHLTKQLLGLETDQGGPHNPATAREPSKNPTKRFLVNLKSTVIILNLIAEEWYRQAIAWYFLRQKYIVLFDRHFFVDYYDQDIAADPPHELWIRRFHGKILDKFYPKPDLTICLDAPAEVLFARKHEGTIELLEERRRSYQKMRALMPHFETIDASQNAEKVFADAQDAILRFYQTRTGAQHVKN
jgi:thymidylate kinase